VPWGSAHWSGCWPDKDLLDSLNAWPESGRRRLEEADPTANQSTAARRASRWRAASEKNAAGWWGTPTSRNWRRRPDAEEIERRPGARKVQRSTRIEGEACGARDDRCWRAQRLGATWTRSAEELTGEGKDDCSIDSKRKIIIIVLRWISSHKDQQSLHFQYQSSLTPYS
jgi:hypothetical protein